ncbi:MULTISPECIES: hypothetical protein [Kitasatospora]|uniref:hypothetical protein n=1 Tax=Kitasatospora TaxID=2063 RepID=UPI0031D962A0
MSRRSAAARVLAAAGLTLSLFGVGASPAAAQARPHSLDNAWACSLPNGYTYDQVQSLIGACGASGFAIRYHLRVPADGLWACEVPPGFTYDQAQRLIGICSTFGFAYRYHLRG